MSGSANRLNNCIGGRNYWMFCGLLLCAQAAAALQLAAAVYILVNSFTDTNAAAAHLASVYFGDRAGMAGLRAIAGVDVGATALISAALGELSCFHVYLWWRGISTYEYIVAQRSLSQQERCGRVLDSAALSHAKLSHACSNHRQTVRKHGLCLHGKSGRVLPEQLQQQVSAELLAAAGEQQSHEAAAAAVAPPRQVTGCRHSLRALFSATQVLPEPKVAHSVADAGKGEALTAQGGLHAAS